jgi:hypothetical protein
MIEEQKGCVSFHIDRYPISINHDTS